MASLATKLSESAQIWRRAVAPFAEGIARALWSQQQGGRKNDTPSTPLTQYRKRKARGSIVNVLRRQDTVGENVCGICGVGIKTGRKNCRKCALAIWSKKLPNAVEIGCDPIAQARRADSQRRQSKALKAWNPINMPTWLDEKFYRTEIQPRLITIDATKIQNRLSVSKLDALRIRASKCISYPRY